MSAQQVPRWLLFGDVMVVEYDRNKFDGHEVVSTVGRAITDTGSYYRRLTLIGTSLGALVADDLINQLAANDNVVRRGQLGIVNIPRRDVILVDGPTGADDLKDPAAKLIARVPFGPIADAHLTWLFWHFGFNPPAFSQLAPETNHGLIEANWQLSKTYPLNGWIDEVRYIVDHPAPVTNLAHQGVKAVYIQSSMDGVVKPTAYQSWLPVYNGHIQLIPVTSSHIELLGYPNNWDRAFDQAFTALG